MIYTTLGIWAWGSVTAILSLATLYIITTGSPPALYNRIKETASAIGGIIAASVLAWSIFFQTSLQQGNLAKQDELTNKLAEAVKKLESVSSSKSQ